VQLYGGKPSKLPKTAREKHNISQPIKHGLAARGWLFIQISNNSSFGAEEFPYPNLVVFLKFVVLGFCYAKAHKHLRG
jgi:hypothetical protein